MRKSFSVLVVDDNPAMADTLSDILAGKGYKVLPAHSGAKTLDISRRDFGHKRSILA